MTGSVGYPLFDPSFVDAVVAAMPSWLAHLVVALTYLGSIYVVVPALVVGYWLAPDRRSVWVPVALGYYGLVGVSKALADTARPDAGPPVSVEDAPTALAPVYEHALVLESGGFPSGHAIAVTTLAGLFVLDGRVGTRRQRLLVAAPLVAIVAATRVALGVHYPVDLVGGVAVAVCFLGTVVAVRRVSDDPTGVLFALAAVLGVVAAWLVTGPSLSGLAWSAEGVVLGGSVGGLVGWLSVRERSLAGDSPGDDFRRLAPSPTRASVLVLALAALAAVHVAVPHPLVTVGLSAVAVAAAVVAPWLIEH